MANKPYNTFEKTLARADALIDLHSTGPNIDEPDDLIRAAVLLSVAGFDRYFTTKFCDVLIVHLKSNKKIGDSLFVRISDAGFTTKFALQLISESVESRNSRPFRKIRTIVQNSLSKHTTHRAEIIDDLFVALGLKGLCENARKKSNKKLLHKSVDSLVELRNEIAHEAHVKNNGEPRSIDVDKVKKRVSDLKLFVKCCDEIVDNKFGTKPAKSA